MSEATIPAVMARAAERFGALNAIEDGDVTLTFSELGAAVTSAARAFIAAGIRPGDRVAVWAPNIWEWVVAAVGAQSVGGVLVPLSTRFKGSEAGFTLERSRARILCTVGEFLGTDYVGLLLEALGGVGDEASGRPIAGLPHLERIVALRDAEEGSAKLAGAVPWSDFLATGEGISDDEVEARAAAVSADDLADILFTSGTTGEPKGVMTAHHQNIRCFESWSEVVGLEEGDRYLVVNPFFHTFGYKAGWLACLMRGATILPHPVFDVPTVLERIGADQVNVLPGAPSLYQSILVHPDRDRYDLSCLRLAVTGAAAIPVELIHRMRDELGFEVIVTAYGLTECTGMVTICRREDDPEVIATTSGRAIPDVEVKCVDAEGREVPVGEAGEILVRGYNVMQGYFEDPAKRRRRRSIPTGGSTPATSACPRRATATCASRIA